MSDSNIDRRLQDGRPEPTAVELDRIKLRVLDRAGAGDGRSRAGVRGMLARSRVTPMILTFGILIGFGGAVLSSGIGAGPVPGFGDQGSAASSQYCPPTSQQPGKPKNPSPGGCGNPKTK